MYDGSMVWSANLYPPVNPCRIDARARLRMPARISRLQSKHHSTLDCVLLWIELGRRMELRYTPFCLLTHAFLTIVEACTEVVR
jgi:hypothetical protein